MFRNDTPTTRMTSLDAGAREPSFISLLEDFRSAAHRFNHHSIGAVIPGDLLPRFADGNQSVLFILLPEYAQDSVEAMLHGEASVFNEQSEDLLRSVTLLTFTAGDSELRLATGAFIASSLDYEKESVAVVVAAGDMVWQRHLVPEDLEALCDELQGAEISSGDNYRPYRIYSEEELKEAAERAAREPVVASDGIYVPRPLSFRRN